MSVFFYDRKDINTDLLFPGKYTYTCATGPEIVEHLLEDLDPEFSRKVQPGDIIMAGSNFGCGSSREQPSLGLKHVGVQAVVARSFARIFYRNAINIGLPVIVSDDASKIVKDKDELEIDLDNGKINDLTAQRVFDIPPLPEFIQKVISSGGYIEYTKAILAEKK